MTEYERIKQEQLEKAIITLYLSPTGKGEVGRFLKEQRISSNKLRQIATNLNVYPSKPQSHKMWSKDEDIILKKYQQLSFNQIQYKLKKNGFRRTRTSVEGRMQRLNLVSMYYPNTYSNADIAIFFGVSSNVIYRWINEGYLRGTGKNFKQGIGTHYHFTAAQIRTFVRDNVNLINFVKVNKFWLIDLLTNKYCE